MVTLIRPAVRAITVVLAVSLLAACGDDDDVETTTGEPVQDSMGSDVDDDGSDELTAEAARQRARDLLGTPEAELDLGPDLRIGRRGEEQFMLTEDYVIGRITVELDDEGSGTYVVTEATVELPGGPETFTAEES